MKQYPLTTQIALFLTIIVAFPAMTHAQENTDIPTHVALSSPIPASIGQFRSHIEDHIQKNSDYRNTILESNLKASTSEQDRDSAANTGDYDGHASNTPSHTDDQTLFASTTGQFSTSTLQNSTSTIRLGDFKGRKSTIIRQMTVALTNLHQIRERINSRIEKEAHNGTDMTQARALLARADEKIAFASSSITILETYAPTASSTQASTTIVNIDPARKISDTATKSVTDANRALQAVVVSIAHALGIDLAVPQDSISTSTTSATAR